MTDERVDLSPLDPTADRAAYELAVGQIMNAATLPLARRRARYTAMGQVSRWWRPMLAAAAAVVLAAVGVLTQVETATAAAAPASTVAEAIGIPASVEAWMTGAAFDVVGGVEVNQ